MRSYRKLLKGTAGRIVASILLVTTTHVFADPSTYLSVLEIQRAKEAEVRAIAAKMHADPEFLLHPEGRHTFDFSALFARVATAVGLGSPATTSSQPADFKDQIARVKSRYALVAADTIFARIAELVEISLSSAATRNKKKGQINAELNSVLRLLDKDFLPALRDSLPPVASSRDARMRSAAAQLRSDVKALLKQPHALDDVNIDATLNQLRQLVTGSLKLRGNGTPRWTKDPFPVKDAYRAAPVKPVDRKYGTSQESSALPTTPAIVSNALGAPASAALQPASTAVAADVAAMVSQLPTPAKAFAFVYDNVDWQSYGGVVKGASGALNERRGNDWDQALLLRDLLTAQGYQAQLEWGRVSIPIKRAMNLAGTEDPLQAANLLATAGFDSVALTQNGVPVLIQMTHAWVRALIPYVPNRGATGGTADTWVRMDPSFKKYKYQAGIEIPIPWSEDEYLQTSAVRAPNDFFGDKLWAYIRANNLTCNNLSQVPKTGAIQAENFPFIPATLNVRLDQIAGVAAEPPAAMMQTVSIAVSDPQFGDVLTTYSANLADLWGRKLSITFPPATADDAAIVASYGGLYNTPAYLVHLKAVIAIDDQTVAEGGSAAAGADLSLDLSFHDPRFGNDSTHHDIVAGESMTEVFDSGRTPDSLISKRMQRLQQLVAQQPADDAQRAAIETEKLNLVGLRYMQEVDDAFDFATGVRWQRWVKSAFEGLVSQRINVSYNFVGSAIRLSPADHNIDVTRLVVGIVPIQNDVSRRLNTMALAGLHSSYLEGAIWEELESQQGISATKALLLARIAGQRLYTADASNVDAVLSNVNLSAEVESEIRGAIAQGRIAIIPSAEIRVNKWQGTGFILRDPVSGSATYPISGGFAGGSSTGAGTDGVPDTLGSEPWLQSVPDLLRQMIEALGNSDDTPTTSQSDPVNISTGNMYRETTDFTIVARGLPIVLKRTYNSRSTYNGAFGYGWTFTYGDELVRNADGSITYRESDGTEHLFTFSGGVYVAPPGKHADLAAAGSGFTLKQSDGMQFEFDGRGRLLVERDLGGNAVTIARDALGLPASVTDDAGRTVLTFTTVGGKITGVTDLSNRSTRYAYTGDDLTSVTDTNGKLWTLQYDLRHNLTQIKDPLGNAQSYDYDVDDRLMQHVDALGAQEFFQYDIAGRESVVTNRLGGDRLVRFDDLGRATAEVDPAGNMSQAAFDSNNNRTSLTDSRGFTATYDYDANGNATREIAPDGGVTTATYDANSRPLTTTEPSGSTTRTYDAAGNLLTTSRTVAGITEQTTNTYDSDGQLLSTTDANGATTSMVWGSNGMLASRTDGANNTISMTSDALGRVTSVKDAAGAEIKVGYDAADRVASVTDPFGVVTSVTYDAAGRRTAINTPRGTTMLAYDAEGRLISSTDPAGNTSSTTYDAAGDIIARTDERGGITRYEYDLNGRVMKMTDAAGGVWSYGYCSGIGAGNSSSACEITDPSGNVVKQQFDAMGRVVGMSDSLAHSSAIAYDLAGRKTSEIDANGNVTRFTYDEAGHLASVLEANNAVTSYTYDRNGNKLTQKDANGNIWTFRYDAVNRLIEEKDPLGRAVAYVYDATGNLKSKTDRKGQTTNYDYDRRRLVKSTYPDGSTDVMTYDSYGRRTSTANANVTLSYTYDALNHVKTVTNQRYNLVAEYSYDAAGNRIQMKTPGSTVNYTYDAKNRLATMNDSFFGSFRFGYDTMDRRTSLQYPNGVVTSYAYDKAYRLTSLVSKDTLGAVLDAWSYQYDAVGNRTVKTDADGHSERYEFDNTHRLTSATYGDGSFEKFTYDGVGNRLTRTTEGGSTLYAYDIANQLLSAGADTFTYDGNGNVLTRNSPRGATTFSYDYKDRLINVNGPDGRETNLYSANGLRVDMSGASIENGQVRVFYDLNQNPIVDWGTDNRIWTYRLYAPGVDTPLAEYRRANNRTSFLHVDGLGSVTAVTNTSGQVLYRSTYKVFGQMARTADPENSIQTRLGFAGREISVGGLMNNRARYYDSTVGRFLQVDTFAGSELTPPSLNRYTYVLNSPVNYIDPSGHAISGWWFVAAGAAIGAGWGAYLGVDAFPWSRGVNMAVGAAIGAAVGALEVLIPGITLGLGVNVNWIFLRQAVAQSTAELTIFSRIFGRLLGLHFGAHVGGVRLWHLHLLGLMLAGGGYVALAAVIVLALIVAFIFVGVYYTITFAAVLMDE